MQQLTRYTEEQKELIRNNLKKVLLFYGAKQGKGNWNCIPHRHNNPKDNLSINGNICCCHCGIKGDSFSVIAEIEGYNISKEFPKIIERGLEILGSETPISYRCSDNENNNKKEIKKVLDKYDLTKIILQNFKNSKGYNYFFKRNIKNKSLFKKYRIMTGDPRYILPKELLPQVYNLWAYQNIIPVWENKKVVNIILRRDDYLSKKNKKILNLKSIPLKIWNAGYLRNSQKNDCYFITEGIFDALSFEQIECKGIALNTITMVDQFIKIVFDNIDRLKENQVTFFIAFDNDQSEKAIKNVNRFKNKLDLALREFGFESFILSLKKFKDINEWFCDDRKFFKERIYKLLKNKAYK